MFKKFLRILGIAASIPGMIIGIEWSILGVANEYRDLLSFGLVALVIFIPLCYFCIKKLIQIDNNTVAYVYANSPKDACICVFSGIILGVITYIGLMLSVSEISDLDMSDVPNNIFEQQYNDNAPTINNKYINISAVDLVDEFNENEIGAKEKYSGKTIIVTGTIDDFTSMDLYGENYSYVVLNGSNANLFLPENVQAVFEKKSEFAKLSKYKKGQEITIKGVCEGKTLLNIIINNCSVVE